MHQDGSSSVHMPLAMPNFKDSGSISDCACTGKQRNGRGTASQSLPTQREEGICQPSSPSQKASRSHCLCALSLGLEFREDLQQWFWGLDSELLTRESLFQSGSIKNGISAMG